MKDSASYIKGSIGGTMMKTAFAMLAGTLAMSGYNIADTYFVGQLSGAGERPLAAMGYTFPAIMLMGCVFHGLGIGVMATSSQALGSNRKEKASKLISSGLLLILLVSVVMGVLGVAFGPYALEYLGAQGETLDMATGYMNIWFIGCVTASFGMTCNDILISAGDSKAASIMMIVGMIINVILDPVMMFGLDLGIRGAAIATVISQGVCAVILMVMIQKRHGLLRFEKIPLRRLNGSWSISIRYAVPSIIGMLMMPIGSVFITKITSHFGDVVVAASTAAGRLENAAFVFPMALGIALMPMVGQNFGARLYSRIRACFKFAMCFAFVYLFSMAVIYFFFAEWLVSFFSESPDVRKYMVICMQIIPWGFWGIEIHRYSGFFFTGCARPSVAAVLNFFRIMVLMVPLAYIALYFESVGGLFLSRMLADVIAGATGVWFTWRLVRSLPERDGDITPPSHTFRDSGRKVLEKLHIIAHAQTDIDSRSSTQ